MCNKVFKDENEAYQFDFSVAQWATDQLHNIFHKNKVSILSDADFLAETNDGIIVLEYKNANIQKAIQHGNCFNPCDPKYTTKIAYKYYDSWIYLKAISKSKPCYYVYIIEHPQDDSSMRKWLRNTITTLLPFQLQKDLGVTEIIRDFDVLNITEWNQHPRYGIFPITPL